MAPKKLFTWQKIYNEGGLGNFAYVLFQFKTQLTLGMKMNMRVTKVPSNKPKLNTAASVFLYWSRKNAAINIIVRMRNTT